MSLLFETIKVDNSKVTNIDYHNERLNRSRNALFGSRNSVDIKKLIKVPGNLQLRVARCRIVYNEEIRKIEYFPYEPRIIKSLKIVDCDDIDYSFKYYDRSRLDELLKLKGKADEILIIKNGLVTDTSFSNIVFYDGEKWITPSDPLLKGTKREQLLKEKIISETEIRVSDLKTFQKAVLVNAMLGLEEGSFIMMSNIG